MKIKTQVGIYTIVIALFLVGVFLLERTVNNSKRKRMCYWLMLIVYCGAVIWFTLQKIREGITPKRLLEAPKQNKRNRRLQVFEKLKMI